MTISLPWPPSVLSPNARPHWAKRARSFKVYKMVCYAVLSQHRNALAGTDSFSLQFCPPDRHRRDVDNMLASAKAALDALSEICGVDDSKFSLTIAKGEPVRGGAIILEAA